MTVFTKAGQQIFAPVDENGNARSVSNQEAQVWSTEVEALIKAFVSGGGLIYSSKASLDADLAHAANSMAWVLGDAPAANNGIYRKIGASGVGSWTRVGDLPYSFIVASDAGAGSPNAIVATTAIPVSESALILLNIHDTNTQPLVTVAFNGGSALTVKTNSGENIATGGLVSGMVVMGVVSGSTFRLTSDEAIASLVYAARDQAVAAATAADESADRAEDALAEFMTETAPLFAVKLQTSTTAGVTDYALATAVPAVNGHLHVNAYLGGVLQPKDGAAYTIIDSGATIHLSEDPGDDQTLYVEGATVYGMAVSDPYEALFDTEAEFLAATIPSSDAFIETAGFYEPADGGGGRWRRLSGAPADPSVIQKQADGKWWEAGPPPSGVLDARLFGATTSLLQTPSARRVCLQNAIDAAALLGVTCRIPAGTWIIDSDLFYRDNSRISAAGKDVTILKLSDDADVECCVMRPEDLDVETVNVAFYGGMTFDANGDRATVTGNPVNRPAGSGLAIAYTNGFYGENLKGINAVLHGIDITAGGDLDGDGVRQYVYPAGAGVYSDTPSRNVTLINPEGAYCGDDAITTHHCAERITIFDSYTHHAVRRYQTGAAPNGLEIDDGSSDVTVFGSRSHDVNRGLAIKCHSGAAAARRVQVFGMQTWDCSQGLYILDENISTVADKSSTGVGILVDGVSIRDVKQFDAAGSTPSAIQLRGVPGAIVKNIDIDGAGFTATYDALGSAIVATLGCRLSTIQDYVIRNWASGTNPVVQLGTATDKIKLLNGSLINCQSLVGVATLGSAGMHTIDGLFGDGSAVTNSVLLETENSPRVTGTAIKNVNGTGYTYIRKHAGITSQYAGEFIPGGLQVNGMFNVGVAVAKTIASDAITVGDSSYVELDTQGAASTDNLATINGGQEGDMLFLRIANSDRDVVVKSGTGNITLNVGVDMTLGSVNDTLTLICRSSGGWTELGRRVSV